MYQHIPIFIRLAFATDILLIAVKNLFPPLEFVLPLGGTDIVQLAILVCLGVVVHEYKDSLGRGKPPDDEDEKGKDN